MHELYCCPLLSYVTSPESRCEYLVLLKSILEIILKYNFKVVKMVKQTKNKPVTAAIGDGANDVSVTLLLSLFYMTCKKQKS